MITVFFCDDNPAIQKKYSDMLSSIADKHGIECRIQCFNSGEELLKYYDECPGTADVIYMDILMGHMNGIDTVRALSSRNCTAAIVYLTSSEEYVFESFDTLPLHYLVKDTTTPEKFEEVFMRAYTAANDKKDEFFSCSNGSLTQKISISSITYFSIKDRITTVHYNHDDSFDFYSTLDYLETRFEKKGFMRIHRSYLVQVKYVKSISKKSLSLLDGTELPMGLTYSRSVKHEFSKFLIGSI